MSDFNYGDMVRATSTKLGVKITTAIGEYEGLSPSGSFAFVRTNTGVRMVNPDGLELLEDE